MYHKISMLERQCLLLLLALWGSTIAAAMTTTTMIPFNHAGASPCSDAVVDRILQHLRCEQSMGAYTAATHVADELETVYSDIARLLHAAPPPPHHDDDDGASSSSNINIALVESATVGWTRLFGAMMAYQQQQQRTQHRRRQQQHAPTRPTVSTILVSSVEYAANLVAIRRWCQQQEEEQQSEEQQQTWTVLAMPSATNTSDGSSTGTVCLTTFQSMLNGTYEYTNAAADDNDTTTTTTTEHNNNKKKIRLDPSTIALVAVTHIPTNAGVINPVEAIGQQIAAYNQQQQQQQHDNDNNHNHKIFYLVDACQSVGHIPIHVERLHCDGLVASGRKYLAGPRGTGFLYVSPSMLLLDVPPDHHVDHFGAPVQTTSNNTGTTTTNGTSSAAAVVLQPILPRPDARRFEFWESSIALRLGLGVAVRQALLLQQQQNSSVPEATARITRQRALYLYERLGTVLHVQRHYRPACGIVTFWSSSSSSPHTSTVSAQEIHRQLLERGFETSVVPATSTPLDHHHHHPTTITTSSPSVVARLPDMVRASVSHRTTMHDMDRLCDAIDDILVRSNRTSSSSSSSSRS